MTYRLDSDIPWLYGWLENKTIGAAGQMKWKDVTRLSQRQVTQYRRNKTKLVAWIVGHCQTDSR